MILNEPKVAPTELAAESGWLIKPQGACLGDVCVPLGDVTADEHGYLDAAQLAGRLRMPLLHDPDAGVWALGPATVTGQALTTARAPEIALPDLDGNPFALSSLKGKKVLLVAWASW